jgi:glycosyltransferase involved in cell wall biosynthesis
MKIGLLIYGSLDTLSGGYLYDRKLVEYLRAQGDEVRILSLPWRNYVAHLADNLTFRLPRGLDVLIEDELNHPSLIAANLRRSGIRYPVVSLVHHLRSSERRPAWQNALYRFVERRYLQTVDGFIFNSQTTRAVVTGLVGEIRPVLVAYPPTDRFGNGLSETQVRARALEPGPLRLLFLGNVIPRKGLHTILKALSAQGGSTGDRPPFRLDVVGSLSSDPLYAREMQAFSGRHCPPGSVHFHGALDHSPLLEKLRQAQVLVVPSSYEGFGIVYLEGMSFGLPAIGSTAGAAAEIIDPDQTGYLVPPENDAALARYLSALEADRALLARLSLNALRRYQSQPRWDQTAGEIRMFLAGMGEAGKQWNRKSVYR